MTNFNRDLTKLQVGPETTPGTVVTATRVLPFTEGTFQGMYDRELLDEARGIAADFDDVVTARSGALEVTQALDVEHLLAAFSCGVTQISDALNATPDPDVWTFTVNALSPAAVDSASLELGLSDGTNVYNEVMAYARPTSIAIEVDEGVAELKTTWVGRAPQPLTTLTTAAAIAARRVIPAPLFKCYIDDAWSSLGTTAFGSVRSFSAEYDTGLVPKHTLEGRPTLDLTGYYRGRFRGTLNMTIDHDGNGDDELAHFKGGDLRFIRMEATVPTNGKLVLDHCVRYIETPDVLAADERQHTLEMVGHLRADRQAAANVFRAIVTNGLASW